MIAGSTEQTYNREWPGRIEPETPSAEARETSVLRTVEQWTGRHPALSVGVAMALGVTLGWLIKRK